MLRGDNRQQIQMTGQRPAVPHSPGKSESDPMRFFPVCSFATVLMIAASATHSFPQEASNGTASNLSPRLYPDSPEGLQNLMGDIFRLPISYRPGYNRLYNRFPCRYCFLQGTPLELALNHWDFLGNRAAE